VPHQGVAERSREVSWAARLPSFNVEWLKVFSECWMQLLRRELSTAAS
jgi:hypothetical protein